MCFSLQVYWQHHELLHRFQCRSMFYKNAVRHCEAEGRSPHAAGRPHRRLFRRFLTQHAFRLRSTVSSSGGFRVLVITFSWLELEKLCAFTPAVVHNMCVTEESNSWHVTETMWSVFSRPWDKQTAVHVTKTLDRNVIYLQELYKHFQIYTMNPSVLAINMTAVDCWCC